MRFGPVAAALVALAGCATPLRPDPQVDLTGDWRVVAINGVATPVRTGAFNFRYTSPTGSAQFGCNWGSGAARAENGWLAPGDWIITVASCPGDRGRFERQGFDILSEPLAIEPASRDRVRLRNARGSITLQRLP